METPIYLPLLDVYRSNYLDNRFFALAFLYDKNGLLHEFGAENFNVKNSDNNAKFYLRSLFKPIQASVLADEIIKTFGFTENELAVMQASHAGEPCHIELVKSVLEKIGLKESDLLCPVIPPLNTKIYKKEEKFSKIHNNCSGKHAMMLAYCKFFGLDIKNYTDFSHPLQIKIKEKLLYYAETNDFISTKDGCTVPVYGLNMQNIARAFLNYYEDENNALLINAFKNNPYIIGGADNFGMRTDTKIMKLSDKLISKVGAGGFIYVFNQEQQRILIVKMAQNNNPEREILTLKILFKIGWLQEKAFDENIYTENNEPVGKYVFNI